MSILSDVRVPLAEALSSVSASVYQEIPEAVIPPACVLVPGTPYLQPNLINGSTIKAQINFIISAIVAYNSNAGALDNLEQLIVEILGAIPKGYVVESVDRPTIAQIGSASMLVSDISVSTYFNN